MPFEQCLGSITLESGYEGSCENGIFGSAGSRRGFEKWEIWMLLRAESDITLLKVCFATERFLLVLQVRVLHYEEVVCWALRVL